MFELFSLQQILLISLVFIWGGFVRSGLGFGGAVLSLPFLLLIHDDPIFFLPIICIHLLFFSTITILPPYLKRWRSQDDASISTEPTINWYYLKRSLTIIIIPKLVGVFGLVSLPSDILTGIIFCIVAVYAMSYLFNKPFVSKNKVLDVIFLIVGGYISGTSLIGAPLIIAVLAKYIDKRQFRDTLFVLWFVLVSIKMSTFIYLGIDLQLQQQLWLLPCAAIGHIMGLHWHKKLMLGDQVIFYRVLGFILLVVSILGFMETFQLI
ncbi:MAG: sulfite exporter TauE/SafE family protein [Sinobacterium sp.]|nr:sulfite exporter TauE/SafE family protein [Sinobacterium sp.]